MYLILFLIVFSIIFPILFIWFFIERPYQKELKEIQMFHKMWEKYYKTPNSDKNKLIKILLKRLEQQKRRVVII